MSAVINKAKLQYRRALGIEAGIILVLAFVLFLWKGYVSISFLAGGCASFVPHSIFVYWVFFRNSTKDRTKMTAFYCGEGIKWLITILLIVLSFTLIPNLQYLVFFVGYFLALFLNIALPMLLSRKST
ncbi:ATP synthase subunit I [Mannheimia sp. AT1]|uniref:ATP synthase subunit I n=1 Tax=Mannheimia cairinae TaxID=3025936 RepID=A0ABT5MPU6_9PAST|nr:ATP synthase subunit I [Mannheimia cairinae]MDD0826677.1 ATP synthase subunit I [Mannheimia cairinae]